MAFDSRVNQVAPQKVDMHQPGLGTALMGTMVTFIKKPGVEEHGDCQRFS